MQDSFHQQQDFQFRTISWKWCQNTTPCAQKEREQLAGGFNCLPFLPPKIGDASEFEKTGRKKTSNYQERSSLKTLDVSIFFRCFFSSAGYFWKRTRHQVIQWPWPFDHLVGGHEQPKNLWNDRLTIPKKVTKTCQQLKVVFFQWGNPEFLVATIAHVMHPKFSRWGSSDPP